mgnify:CR=1 FL=1
MSDIRNPINLLGSDVELTGSITLKSDCTIDCTLKGTVTSEASVIIGENAEVHADIKARSVTIMGRVTGNVQVLDKCELKPRGVLVGDLRAPRMVIEEGATFVGRSEVRPDVESELKSEIGGSGFSLFRRSAG